MSYGIKVIDEYNKVYDTSAIPAMLYEVLAVVGGSSGSKAYPELAGFTMDCATYKESAAAISRASDHVVTYDLGYPVLSWSPSSLSGSASTQSFFVFVW